MLINWSILSHFLAKIRNSLFARLSSSKCFLNASQGSLGNLQEVIRYNSDDDTDITIVEKPFAVQP